MNVGIEWLVEASGCRPEALTNLETLRALFARIVLELDLRPVDKAAWHVFPGAGGITGYVMLTESHLAIHTYPELGVATLNLYCCRERDCWAWDERLREILGADHVRVRSFQR